MALFARITACDLGDILELSKKIYLYWRARSPLGNHYKPLKKNETLTVVISERTNQTMNTLPTIYSTDFYSGQIMDHLYLGKAYITFLKPVVVRLW